jgi:hypothetical protein
VNEQRATTEEKRVADIIKIPVQYLHHCDASRNLRDIDSDFVQVITIVLF